jgi:hypothetical protein
MSSTTSSPPPPPRSPSPPDFPQRFFDVFQQQARRIASAGLVLFHRTASSLRASLCNFFCMIAVIPAMSSFEHVFEVPAQQTRHPEGTPEGSSWSAFEARCFGLPQHDNSRSGDFLETLLRRGLRAMMQKASFIERDVQHFPPSAPQAPPRPPPKIPQFASAAAPSSIPPPQGFPLGPARSI